MVHGFSFLGFAHPKCPLSHVPIPCRICDMESGRAGTKGIQFPSHPHLPPAEGRSHRAGPASGERALQAMELERSRHGGLLGQPLARPVEPFDSSPDVRGQVGPG
jgi:hypothetical protein